MVYSFVTNLVNSLLVVSILLYSNQISKYSNKMSCNFEQMNQCRLRDVRSPGCGLSEGGVCEWSSQNPLKCRRFYLFRNTILYYFLSRNYMNSSPPSLLFSGFWFYLWLHDFGSPNFHSFKSLNDPVLIRHSFKSPGQGFRHWFFETPSSEGFPFTRLAI